MADVTRPGGVTAAAVIALIGSIGAAASGVMMLLAGVAMNQPEVVEAMARQPATPFSPLAMMVVMAVMSLAFAAWGCASAVAVLRLKRWGRTSFLVFGGILAALGVLNAVGAVFGMVLVSAMPLGDANVPRGLLVGMMGGMLVFTLVMVALGAWWLVMFNRAAVKTLFAGTNEVSRDTVAIPMRVL